jgi:hypothetical protein
MTTKLLSLVTASGITYVSLQSQLHSDDALFLVASGNLVINIGLGVVAALAIYLSFIKQFKYRQTYTATVAAAIGLIFIGFAGFAYSGIDYYFGIIKPLDYVILMQLGLIFGIYALSYKHPRTDLTLVRLSRDYGRFKRGLVRKLPKPAIATHQTHRPRPA